MEKVRLKALKGMFSGSLQTWAPLALTWRLLTPAGNSHPKKAAPLSEYWPQRSGDS